MILRFRQRLSKKSKLLKKKKPWKILLRQILPSPFGKKFKLLIHKYTLFLMMKSTNAWNYPHKISLIWQKNPSTLAVTSFLPASIRLITTSCWEKCSRESRKNMCWLFPEFMRKQNIFLPECSAFQTSNLPAAKLSAPDSSVTGTGSFINVFSHASKLHLFNLFQKQLAEIFQLFFGITAVNRAYHLF